MHIWHMYILFSSWLVLFFLNVKLCHCSVWSLNKAVVFDDLFPLIVVGFSLTWHTMAYLQYLVRNMTNFNTVKSSVVSTDNSHCVLRFSSNFLWNKYNRIGSHCPTVYDKFRKVPVNLKMVFNSVFIELSPSYKCTMQ